MVINKISNYPNVLWEINGVIDSDNYHDFEKEILSLNYDGTVLTLDFKGVPYITSAAIRVLLVARKHIEKDKLIILNANKDVKEIFDSAGFLDMLTFENREDDNPLHKSFKTLFNDVVKSSKDKEAYIMGEDRYTWGDIDKCSQIIAKDLSLLGVKKGSHVGIISTNSINWICTFFAIQKIGGIVCSINFNSKKEELVSLSNIGDVDFLCYGIVTAIDDYKNFFDEEIFKISSVKKTYDININIDFRKRFNEYENIKNDFSEIMNADDPSLIIFTSGSTGKPKAVLSSSYNRISVFCSEESYKDNEMYKDSSILIYLPLFHIFAISQVLIKALIYKIKIFITTNSKIETILDLIQKEKCEFFPTVPTFIASIIKYENFKPEMVDSVKYILFGGEPITEEQIKNCNKMFRNAKIGIGYGMSEITPISNSLYGDSYEHLTKTVGKVHDYIDIKIVDKETNELLDIGQIGEICVKSEAAMVDYYKLDIKDQAIDNEGYIKTGDLGYMREDGYLSLTGRCKELIIRSGENISPNEIVDALSSNEDIAQVKVYGVPDEKHGEAVAAAVIMKNGRTLDKNKLNDFLLKRIAKFKVPEYYVEFKTFPLLSNNKIDGVSIRKQMMDILGIK